MPRGARPAGRSVRAMCFSATASFVAGGTVAGVGAATLSQVRRPRDLGVAALPLAFGAHQVAEGMVWLGVQGHAPLGLGPEAAVVYLLWAQVLLPLVGPLAVLAFVPERRRWLRAFVPLGAVVFAYLAASLVWADWGVVAEGSSLVYRNPWAEGLPLATGYVVATVGPFLASGRRVLEAFGVVTFVGLLATVAAKAYAFTSVWCFVAALASTILFVAVRRQREAVTAASGVPAR